jgi:hypothetical membrane protein
VNRPRVAGTTGLALLALSTLAMLALHRARPDLDPIRTPVSFYVRGAGGWLLTVSLMGSGLGVIAIASSLVQRMHRRTGAWLLAAGGIGLVVAAVFPADLWFPWEKALTPMGFVHAAAVMLPVGVFPVGALLITRDERETRGPGPMNRILDVVALMFAAVLAISGVIALLYIASGRTPGFLGLAERIMMTLAVAWLAAASRTPVTKAASPRPSRSWEPSPEP